MVASTAARDAHAHARAVQVAWYGTGLGYAVAAGMAAANAMTAAALAALLFGAQLNGINPSLAAIRANGLWVLQALISFGYAR